MTMRKMKKESSDSMCEWPELYALGLLNDEQRIACESHLLSCSKCRLLVEETVQVIVGMAGSAAPALEAKERFAAMVRDQKQESAPAKPEILFDVQGLLAISSSTLSWQAAADGVWVKTLFEDKARNYRTSLVKLDSGTRYPAHRHAAVEEAFVLEGDLHYDIGVLHAGDYCRSVPGSIHSPSHTEAGCILLVSTSMADELLA